LISDVNESLWMLLCDIASLSRLSITYSFLGLASYALKET